MNGAPSPREVRVHKGRYEVGDGLGGWRIVHPLVAAGTTPSVTGRPRACLDLGAGVSCLVLETHDGATTTYVLDADLRLHCALREAEQALQPELLQRLRTGLGALVLTLSWAFGRGQPRELAEALSKLPQEDLVLGLRLAQIDIAAATLEGDPEHPITLPGASGPVVVTAGEIAACIGRLPVSFAEAGRKCGARLPSLTQLGEVDGVFTAVMSDPIQAWICVEATSGFWYYVITSPDFAGCLYIPAQQRLLALNAHTAAPPPAVLKRLAYALLPAARFREAPLPNRTLGVAIWSGGFQAFGHAIWDEMHSLDAWLIRAPAECEPPHVLFNPQQSGLDLYAPAEELYPEMAGRVMRVRSVAQGVAAALDRGKLLVVRSGRRTLGRSRQRVERAAGAFAARTGLAEQIQTGPGAGRLTLTLGLRLTNRRPVDLLGFYARLTKAAAHRFGSLRVIIDGINGDSAGGAAAPVYNGLHKVGVPLHEALREGRQEMQAELEWAEQYAAALADEDVLIVNCVGSPILENLSWIAASHFFVAPLGGGLAKVRWALDRPGFVLASRINLEHSDQLHVYDDPRSTEAPFQPLYFTEVGEVEDLPLDPPRTEPPVSGGGIPHPEDFRLDEPRVIGRVLDLIAHHAPQFDRAPAARVEGETAGDEPAAH